jgi:glucose-1-phosphate cytidylyltransferase
LGIAMKAVILAGGMGTRLSEETGIRPKPMVEVGEQPILWHILKIYSAYGVNDFVICCGYKSHIIKQYFRDYMLRTSSTTFDMRTGDVVYHDRTVEPWRITLVETGRDTMTGGRLRRVREHIGDETFFMTYGDGVSDVNIASLLAFHRAHGKLATVTAVQPPGRFGVFSVSEHDPVVHSFTEKPNGDGSWINGGFFVLNPEVLDYIEGDDTVWEQAPMRQLAGADELVAYRHAGFWHSMDTLRDRAVLQELWAGGSPPWRVWEAPTRPRPVTVALSLTAV